MKAYEISREDTLPPVPIAPPLRDLWGTASQRCAALEYHVSDRLLAAFEHASHHMLKRLPPSWASQYGAALAFVPKYFNRNSAWIARMRRSISHIRPELQDDEEAQDAFIASWWEHHLRTHTEYPILHKLRIDEHVEMTWDDRSLALLRSGSRAINVSCHLGSFEGFGNSIMRLANLDGRVFGIYEPQPSRSRNQIVVRIRWDRGIPCLPPTRRTRAILPRLMRSDGQVAMLYIDENIGETVGFPLFGRKRAERSNLTRALKMARVFDAPIMPIATYRTGPGRAYAHLHAPIMPDEIGRSSQSFDRIAERLNAIFEPLVRRHLEQWFTLPWMDFSRNK